MTTERVLQNTLALLACIQLASVSEPYSLGLSHWLGVETRYVTMLTPVLNPCEESVYNKSLAFSHADSGVMAAGPVGLLSARSTWICLVFLLRNGGNYHRLFVLSVLL